MEKKDLVNILTSKSEEQDTFTQMLNLPDEEFD